MAVAQDDDITVITIDLEGKEKIQKHQSVIILEERP
jgi:hypothetical protein